MKTYRKKIVALLLLGFGITTVHGQQATTATGGNASGSGGTAAYSVGQVVYTTNTGTNGSVAQGVQQAYEITSVGINETELNISLQACPNPTTDYLQLRIESEKLQDLNYQLFDIAGKLIENKKITSTTEIIRMENLPTASYFLKVVNNNNEIKTFKIIKN
jgi:hypothetical protein